MLATLMAVVGFSGVITGINIGLFVARMACLP